jgi:uncharacterized protein (TIGR02266 family)
MTVSEQQSNESGVTARLIELINKLSEKQQQALLTMLEDWQDTNRREHPRKPCFIAVDYADRERAFKDFIKNISTGGVFIETDTPFSVGRDLTLTFSSSNYERPIKITGEIVRAGRVGIGVKFKTENQHLEAMIESLSGIEAEDSLWV